MNPCAYNIMFCSCSGVDPCWTSLELTTEHAEVMVHDITRSGMEPDAPSPPGLPLSQLAVPNTLKSPAMVREMQDHCTWLMCSL